MRFKSEKSYIVGDFIIKDTEKKLPALFVIYSCEEEMEDWINYLNEK